MTAQGPRHDVRSASVRVALTAAAVVGIVYFAVATAVVVFANSNLTGQIDARLQESVTRFVSGPARPGPGAGFEPPRGGPTRERLGIPLVVWTIGPNGSVTSFPSDAGDLPAEYRNVSGPQTVTIDGAAIRIQGSAAADQFVVVGQSLEGVERAISTILLGELLIAPMLLGVVFLGAVVIGRRVATPVEQARLRQMEFTADASHELRTPLSVIEAHTSLALQQDRSVEWYRRAFARVDTEAKRISHLLDDLLWLARFDATRGQPTAEPVDVAVLAAQTTDRFASVAETRHLDLSLVTAGESQVIVAPADWLDRLLGVLLDNACKYSPDGGSVCVSVAVEADRVRLTVDDSGPGIPAHEQSRIFDRFHRATDTAGGSGLGLAIADAVVKATNGRWRIDSSPAGGASMSVSWPRALSGAREAPARRSSAARASTD